MRGSSHPVGLVREGGVHHREALADFALWDSGRRPLHEG
jgi:hypothetical protein